MLGQIEKRMSRGQTRNICCAIAKYWWSHALVITMVLALTIEIALDPFNLDPTCASSQISSCPQRRNSVKGNTILSRKIPFDLLNDYGNRLIRPQIEKATNVIGEELRLQ